MRQPHAGVKATAGPAAMKWRAHHVLLEVLAAVVVAVAVLVAVAAWRLAQGPVSIGFLTPYMARMLADVPDVRIDVRDTILTWSGWSRPLDVRAVDVTAIAADGRLIAAVPEIAVRLSIRALLRGELEPTRISVYQPLVRLVRREDGAFLIGIGTGSEEPADRLRGVAQAFLDPPREGAPFRYLRRFELVGGSLRVEDRALGFTWGSPDASLRMVRTDRDITLQYAFRADLEDQAPEVRGSGRYDTVMKTLNVETRVAGLWPARLAARSSALGALAAVDLPVDARARMGFDARGHLTSGRIEISGGAGRLALTGLLERPVPVRSLRMEGSLKPSPERFELETLVLDLGGPTVTATATASAAHPVASIDGHVTVRNLPVADLGAYWPASVAPNALRWVSKNLTDGVVREATADLNVRVDWSDGGLHVDSLGGTLDVAGLTVHYFRPLPPATDVAARGRFGEDSLTFQVARGAAKGLVIDGGTVALLGLGGENERLDLTLTMSGPLAAALEIVDHPPLGFAGEFGIDPQVVAGTASTRLKVALPLLDDLPFSRVALQADSELSGVALPGFVLGRDLDHANLTLHVDNRGMTLGGRGAVADVMSDISLIRHFQPADGVVGESVLKARVAEEDRKRLGIDLAPYVGGPVELAARMTEATDGSRQFAVDLGLAPATLAIPALGWEKPAGDAAQATAVLSIGSGSRIVVDRFGLTAGALSLSGSGALSGDGGAELSRIDVERFHLGQTSLSGSARRDEAGGFTVTIEGSALDARPLLEISDTDEDDEDEEGFSRPVHVTARIDRVIAASNRAFTNVRAEGRHDGRRWQAVDLSARVAAARTARLEYRADDAAGRIAVQSDDAGELLAGLGISDSFAGGRFDLSGRRSGAAEPWTGRATVKDFRVKGMPALARLLTLASLTGIRDVLAGNGIWFNRMEVPYTLKDGTLGIHNARSVGSELGVTADGTIDLDAGKIDLRGTLVPAYTLNSMLGHIPLLGRLFTGSKGSGVFAVSFAVTDELDRPTVTVNPLSVLAPGLLRNLVDLVLEAGPATDEPAEPSPEGPLP